MAAIMPVREFISTVIRKSYSGLSRFLSLEKIRRVLGKSIALYEQIDQNAIPMNIREKRQVISQTELLLVNSSIYDTKYSSGLLWERLSVGIGA